MQTNGSENSTTSTTQQPEFLIGSHYRSERLRLATIKYLESFRKAYELFGHTDKWPYVIEQGVTDDHQILELLEVARDEWVQAERE